MNVCMYVHAKFTLYWRLAPPGPWKNIWFQCLVLGQLIWTLSKSNCLNGWDAKVNFWIPTAMNTYYNSQSLVYFQTFPSISYKAKTLLFGNLYKLLFSSLYMPKRNVYIIWRHFFSNNSNNQYFYVHCLATLKQIFKIFYLRFKRFIWWYSIIAVRKRRLGKWMFGVSNIFVNPI